MTPKEFQAKAKAAFLKQNPGATLGWLKAPRMVEYPTGVKGWVWQFDAKLAGHKPTTMTATGDETYVMVR